METKNQPLSNAALAKVVAFGVLLIPACVFVVGLFPAAALAGGIWMTKRTRDFSHLKSAVLWVKCYFFLWMIAAVLGWVYVSTDRTETLAFALFGSLAAVYWWAVNVLFLRPLRSHSSWVRNNGIFTSQIKVASER